MLEIRTDWRRVVVFLLLPLLLLELPLKLLTGICPLVKCVGELFINVERDPTAPACAKVIPTRRRESVQDCKGS